MQQYITLSFIAILSFFTPIFLLLYVIIGICTLDMITAIGKDIKRHGGRDISFLRKFHIIKSRKLRRTTIKTSLYLLLVMMMYAIPFSCFGVTLFIPELTAFAIMSHEAYSIGENMGIITGSNISTKIIKKSISRITEYISKSIEDNKS